MRKTILSSHLIYILCISLVCITFLVQKAESGGCDSAVVKLKAPNFNSSLCFLPRSIRTCAPLSSLVTNPSSIIDYLGCKVSVCQTLGNDSSNANCVWKTAKEAQCCMDYDNNRVCIDTTNTEYIKYSRWRRYQLYFLDACYNTFYSEIDIPNTRYADGYSREACDYIYGSIPSPKAKCSNPPTPPPAPPAPAPSPTPTPTPSPTPTPGPSPTPTPGPSPTPTPGPSPTPAPAPYTCASADHRPNGCPCTGFIDSTCNSLCCNANVCSSTVYCT